MKSRVRRNAAILAAVLLTPVVALWAGSYWHGGFLQHRENSWSGGALLNRSASIGIKQGQFEIVVSHHSLNMEVPREGGAKVGGYLPMQAFSDRFGGQRRWDYGFQAAPAGGEKMAESVLGLAWGKVVTPGEGDGIALRVPAWYVAAFMLIPPAWMIRQPRRRRRGASSCRYDTFAGLRGRPSMA